MGVLARPCAVSSGATLFYGLRALNAEEARRQFAPIHRFLLHKWYFDELYAMLFVRPTLVLAGWVAAVDKSGIDAVAHAAARAVGAVARLDDWIDRIFVDGLVNLTARWTHALGLRLRGHPDRQPAAVRHVDCRRHGCHVPVGQHLLELDGGDVEEELGITRCEGRKRQTY